jgi:hypothetical protein
MPNNSYETSEAARVRLHREKLEKNASKAKPPQEAAALGEPARKKAAPARPAKKPSCSAADNAAGKATGGASAPRRKAKGSGTAEKRKSA